MRGLVLAAAAALLGGCSSINDYVERKTDYRSAGPAKRLPPLEVPPDLTAPTQDGRYAMPEQQAPTSTATFSGYQAGRAEKPAEGKSAVLPTFDRMQVQRAGTQRWLAVQASPEALWPILKEFWKEQGFEIEVERPQAGIMETQWAENRAKIPLDVVSRTLSRVAGRLYSTGELDKFRTRLERSPEGSGTEIYISHRGVQEIEQTAIGAGGPTGVVPTIWQPRPVDPGLEADFLQRLMVKLGANEERAQQLASPQQPAYRAELRKGVGGRELLEVYEPFDRAWRRVGLALDRVGFTVEDRDRQKGLYFVRYADPANAKDERGFFARIFSSSPEVKPEQYRVQITQAGTSTQVNVLDKNGADDSSQTASRILSLLHEQLK
ncbi:MAG TPA: outer membrane protein assembly factor BamC [Burkholderiales bacterium]|nr:outer membrane protein assembly factor BamC [Burkholderiales bacterium]